MENFKLYVDTTKPNVKLKFRLSYIKPSETHNWATGEVRKTGYRVNAIPVEVEQKDGYKMESFGAFTGFGDTILECNRRSKKRYEQAQDMLIAALPDYVRWFKDRGYELTAEAKEQVLAQADLAVEI
jgi:hypothetical protein